MMSLLERLVRPERRLSDLNVTVYSRSQCCCCHTAIDLLESRRQGYGFRIDVVDVDTDPALAEAHGLSVPVVAFDGKVRFRGVVNPVLLDRLLRGEARRSSESVVGRSGRG